MIQIVIVLIVIGVLLYLVTYIPMDATIRRIINIVIIIAVVLWLLTAFGLLGAMHDIRIGRP